MQDLRNLSSIGIQRGMLGIDLHMYVFVLCLFEDQIRIHFKVYGLVVLKENHSLSRRSAPPPPNFPSPKMMMNEAINPGQGLHFSFPVIRPINEARQSFRQRAYTTHACSSSPSSRITPHYLRIASPPSHFTRRCHSSHADTLSPQLSSRFPSRPHTLTH